MDMFERMRSRARALWRAGRKGQKLSSLWRFENWANEGTEDHHIARAKYGDGLIPAPIGMHQELTRRQMEEHPPEGPDPSNPLERKGRLALGLADIAECVADGLRQIGEKLIEEARTGARDLDAGADIDSEFATVMRLFSGRLMEIELSRTLDLKE
ncbi:hypothetical protein [Methylocystis sp. B8]|uniref:hypothetical protein n=1 Tax=Methylocystis sp. B8 TaxID=544938 RepID=UPI0010FE3562|nr:hypothetical protein [Methylocystis sp. B8]TLG78141.1 hypothetical protein FEV16_06155 [Methylocystis sp. B8]